eukprot:7387674-Prymnesium_polylepis.1
MLADLHGSSPLSARSVLDSVSAIGPDTWQNRTGSLHGKWQTWDGVLCQGKTARGWPPQQDWMA